MQGYSFDSNNEEGNEIDIGERDEEFGRRKIMNNMKREMSKLKGVDMMMQNMVMV